MITSIELQIISKILTSESPEEIDALCSFDESYYSIFKPHIKFILDHKNKYNDVPGVFTFQAQFPDITLVKVRESLAFLTEEMNKNKQHIILLETFNKLKELGSEDVTDAWTYLSNQCERVANLDSTQPLNIIKDAQKRARQVQEYSRQARIPTGFDEIDKVMYGGLSTVEELLLLRLEIKTVIHYSSVDVLFRESFSIILLVLQNLYTVYMNCQKTANLLLYVKVASMPLPAGYMVSLLSLC